MGAEVKNKVTNLKNQIAKVQRLYDSCERELLYSNSLNILTIRGISISRKDVEVVMEYCRYFTNNKTIGGMMPPRGSVFLLLQKIELC